MFGKLI